MIQLTMKNSRSSTLQILPRSFTWRLVRNRNARITEPAPQYRLGSPSLNEGVMPPFMLPATCRMASSRPFQVFSLAMFSLKPSGKLLTLLWVVCSAASVGSDSIAVMPMARAEKKAIRSRSRKNLPTLLQRQIWYQMNSSSKKMQVNRPI